MIYLISDLHGEHDFKGLNEYIRDGKEDDLLIILGDVMMEFEDTEKNRKFTEYMLSIQKNIAILDGNHENFPWLKSFPEEDWNGGRVHRLNEHMVHLMRGNIYELEGKSFFAFGGCKCGPKWKPLGLWYEGDEPTEEEYALARKNLAACDHRVDYILTHKYEGVPQRGTLTQSLFEFTAFLEANVTYKMWYAGHWHTNERVNENHMLVFDELTPVE